MLGDEVGALFRDLHTAHGVTFRFGTGVQEFAGQDGRLRSVVLTDGTELPADVAVVAIGIVPNTELAVAGGLTVTNGILTDMSLRTSDPNVFACGDVACTPNTVAGQPIRVEHWSNALNGGPVAARAMLGQEAVHDPVPYFYTDQYDLGMEFSGWFAPGGYARVVFRGDPTLVDGKVPEYLVFWLAEDNRVLAGMNVNIWDKTDAIRALVRSGRTVDPDALADPAAPLPA